MANLNCPKLFGTTAFTRPEVRQLAHRLRRLGRPLTRDRLAC